MESYIVKRILFRADAKPSIGIGDLVSLIHLSQYLGEDWEIFFVIKNYKASVEVVKNYNIKNTEILDENISIEDEVHFLNSLILQKKIYIVFFEITERKLTEYNNISKYVKKACVNFDGEILQQMKLVVNWDIKAECFYDLSLYPDTKFLLGPKYVILPQEFYSKRIQNRKYSTKVKKVLLAMGGADENDFTTRILEALVASGWDLEIVVIIGAGYEKKEKLQRYVMQYGAKVSIKQNVTNMIDEYLNCDIAIGAGGLTSSELVASRTPALLIATYEHQIKRCKFFDLQGYAKYLGYRTFDLKELKKFIKNPIHPPQENFFETYAIVKALNEL